MCSLRASSLTGLPGGEGCPHSVRELVRRLPNVPTSIPFVFHYMAGSASGNARKELGQYPAILTSRLVNNEYTVHVSLTSVRCCGSILSLAQIIIFLCSGLWYRYV